MEDINSQSTLQYAPPLQTLKAQIVNLMKERNVLCSHEQIFLTSGAQQAMKLICQLLVDKGDSIIIEEATYPGFIQIAKSVQANLVTIPIDYENGIIIEKLENILAKSKNTKLIYTIPEGHNPLGISLSKENRLKLINIALSYKIPIVEDDAYGFINYGEVAPPLRSYCSNLVFYIGSFSKILSPATRVGWIIVPEPFIGKLEILKECMDINTSTLAQHIISTYLNKGYLSDHIYLIRNYYKEKRDKMIEALNCYIPEMQFNIPDSGFFICGRLPNHIDTNKLFEQAIERQKVSFLPGIAFGVSNKSNLSNCMRLSFAFCPTNSIEIGIKRLRDAIKEYETN